MTITIGNRWTHIPGLQALLAEHPELRALLSYRHPKWNHIKQKWERRVWSPEKGDYITVYTWNGYISYVKDSFVPTGLYEHLREQIGQYVQADEIDRRTAPRFKDIDTTNLIGKQPELLKYMQRVISRKGGGLVIAATSTGKTFLAGAYFKSLIGRGLFLVDDQALAYQTRADLQSVLGEPVGIVGDSMRDFQRITVGIVDTLSKHTYDELRLVNALLIDELHEALNKSTWKVVTEYKPQVCIGLTGTLNLLSSEVKHVAYSMCGPSKITYTKDEAEAHNIIAKVKTFLVDAPFYLPDADVLSTANCYAESVAHNEWVNTFAARMLANASRDAFSPCVFALRREHCKRMVAAIEAQGLPAVEHSGAVSKKVRIAHRIALSNDITGEVMVASTATMTKGASVKTLSFLMDLSQTSKWESTVQRIGRALRKHPSKEYAVYIDFAFIRKKVRGVLRPNSFEKAARLRRAGMQRQGYTDSVKFVVDMGLDPYAEADRLYTSILSVCGN